MADLLVAPVLVLIVLSGAMAGKLDMITNCIVRKEDIGNIVSDSLASEPFLDEAPGSEEIPSNH